jgi:hypothetical protein
MKINIHNFRGCTVHLDIIKVFFIFTYGCTMYLLRSTLKFTFTSKKLITFTYYNPLIRKIANLFKQTNLNIALRTTNTICQQLTEKPLNTNRSGIYILKFSTCNNAYIGQSGRSITIRHKEYTRYIRTNNQISAYALHILNNRHEYGTAEETLELLKPCNKGTRMNCWETF